MDACYLEFYQSPDPLDADKGINYHEEWKWLKHCMVRSAARIVRDGGSEQDNDQVEMISHFKV